MERCGATFGGKSARVLVLACVLAFLGCKNEIGGGACKGTEDCLAGETCLDGVCTAGVSCQLDMDCGPGALCITGKCVSALDPNPDSDGGQGPTGGPGIARVSPEGEIDFGSPALGVGIERVVSLLNVGTGPLSLVSISRGDTTSEEFAWSTERTLPAELDVGDRIEVTLVYTLADGEDDLGTIYLETDAGACEPACDDPARIAIPLVSEFKGERNLAVTPEEHDFGYVPAGSQSGARALLITNDGTLDKVLTVTGLAASGDEASFDFELPSPPVYLAPGQSLEVPVIYAPTAAAAAHSLTFTVTANSDSPANTSKQAVFRGTSQPPNALVFEPPELVFEQISVGTTSQQISVLRNLGGGAIRVDALQLGPQSPVEYSVFAAQTLPYTIAPGGSMAVYVDFTAQAGQPSANNVRALNNQPSGDVPVLSVRGQGFVPPGGPNLEISMGPEDNTVTTDCVCDATGDVPAANVDIAYRAPSGAACSKPQNPACGLSGGSCDCPALDSYGDVTWGASRVETVRGETWIVDERVRHEGMGSDGTFTVRADLLDDCLAAPGSTDRTTIWTCGVYMDCDGGNQACVDYGVEYPDCESQWDYWSYYVTSHDCLMRGPVTIRTRVRIYGGPTEEVRELCTTLNQSGASADVVTLARQNGYFQITQVSPSATEVQPGQPCP